MLKNSRLRDDQLERIWDISDLDSDGRLDFEEFCVAMRLVFDLVNGELAEVPAAIPDWLVPEGKAHFVQASRAISSGPAPRPAELDDDDEDGPGGLKDGFDWYMAPAQIAQYTDIYNSARDAHGYVSFPSLSDLYNSLNVPDTDVRSAWNLVNPAADEVIAKDACLAFLHALRARHEGYRLPRTVPASLRATFDRKGVDYNVERVRNTPLVKAGDDTASARKAKFGDAYLSRLGGGVSGARATPKGTDFGSGQTTEDWEEVRLKKQLKDLEAKIQRVEEAQNKRSANGGSRRDAGPALVKRELEQLLDYKRKELRTLESSEGQTQSGGLGALSKEIDTVKEQVDGLASHLKKREEALADLQRQIREEKGR